MTPEEQRIAIARHFGWDYIHYNGRIVLFPPSLWETDPNSERVNPSDFPNLEVTHLAPPNYSTSLDAMHAAEKMLKAMPHDEGIFTPWERYARTLVSELGTLDALHATAAQRSEVFLHTIGKWKY